MINIYNLTQAQQSIESGEIIGVARLCSNEILNIQEVPMLESDDEFFGWESEDESLPPLIPLTSDDDYVESQHNLPSPPYGPIAQWSSLSPRDQERRLAQGTILFEHRNLEDISGNEATTEVISGQAESGMDSEQENQHFIGMLDTAFNVDADSTNEGKTKVRSVTFSNPVKSVQSNFNFPSRTVELLSAFPRDKTFSKQMFVPANNENTTLKEDSEGWLSLKSKSKEVSDIVFLNELESCLGQDLTLNQKKALSALLLSNKDLFGDKVGLTPFISHKIENSGVVFSKPRKLSMMEHDQADQLTAAMLKDGVVRPSSSPYNSPILMVTKKDGSIRFCVDYRRLNKATKVCKYPLTNVSSCFDKLKDSYYFTSLDFQSAYWSVPMAEEDKEKTAFTVRSGKFEFNVMPFGLTNAVAFWSH